MNEKSRAVEAMERARESLKRSAELVREQYKRFDASQPPVRVVTVNGKEFVVRKDEHGEFYEPLAGAPAKAAE